LLEHYHDVVEFTSAVAPSADSLDRLRLALPGVVTHRGFAERTGLADSSVDAVVVGAAFHWFTRPDAEREIARVLSPGGTVTLLWNPIDRSDPVHQVFADIRRSTGLSGDEFDDKVVLDRRWFGPASHAEFTEHRSVSVDSLLEQLASRSYVLLGRIGIPACPARSSCTDSRMRQPSFTSNIIVRARSSTKTATSRRIEPLPR
jgi:SAM-dependent methyltransferase